MHVYEMCEVFSRDVTSQEKFAFIECEFHKINPFECECEFNHMLTCL